MFDISGEMCTLASWVSYTVIIYFLRISVCHNLNQTAFNRCKHSFVCTLLIQVYYSALFNPAAPVAAPAATHVFIAHLFALELKRNEWRSLRLMKVNLWPFLVAAHAQTVVHTSPLLLFFVCVQTHGSAYFGAHNGELLGAILGMSGLCCMFSWGAFFFRDSSYEQEVTYMSALYTKEAAPSSSHGHWLRK